MIGFEQDLDLDLDPDLTLDYRYQQACYFLGYLYSLLAAFFEYKFETSGPLYRPAGLW